MDGYRYGFNGKEGDDEIKNVEGSSYDFGARMLDTRIGRFFSTDPIVQPYETPYNFAANNPIIYIDKEGEDNIIYLVILPSARETLTVKEINSIISETKKMLEDKGLCTEVVLYDSPDLFDARYTDSTDSFVLMGSTTGLVETIKENPYNFYDLAQEDYKSIGKNGTLNPELSSGGGQGIMFDTDLYEATADEVKESKAKAAAYVILHGLGHNVGSHHDEIHDSEGEKERISNPNWISKEFGLIAKAINPEKLYYDEDGVRITAVNPKIKSLDDAIANSNNPSYSEKVKSKMGDNQPQDNYEKNKNAPRKIGPLQKNGKF